MSGTIIKYASLLLIILGFASCRTDERTLFTTLQPSASGVEFVNKVEETPEINILSYEYTYNGGGVAAADFNNDGLCDLYFTGNAVSNKLYINRGDLKFEDVTEQSGTGGRAQWKTGVTAVDVNGDGWMDIYVCYSGPDTTYNLSNQLFINNGGTKGQIPTFTESAVAYGLDAQATFSTQSAFFDYDKDGDLDMFLINHGNEFFSPFINTNTLRNLRHPNFGNRLYRNEMIVDSKSGTSPGKYYTEVSSEAGIHGGGINFALGVSISDFNNDGWPDIFVTNDYEEQDFLYINNADGTFRDMTKKSLSHFSRNGMGSDAADFNNDGLIDLVEVDMWPEDNYRQKLLKGPDDYHRYNLMVDSGFHYQQMRNTLQLNAGIDDEGTPIFCEIGQLAGISSTDWSWAPLFADFDNDGFLDLYVSNGYLRDFTSMDFLKYTVEEERKKSKQEGKELNLYQLVSKMSSTKTPDYVFRNNGDLTFADVSKEWGVGKENLSFGMAYADLDNDGDLDIILNNTNEPATILVNNSRKMNTNGFVRAALQGPASNPFGVGAKVTLKTSTGTQTREQFLSRGFQSSIDHIIHFGTAKDDKVDITVEWPDGLVTTKENVPVNELVEIRYSDAQKAERPGIHAKKLFDDVTTQMGVDFQHVENKYDDFDHELLLPYKLSRMGPPLAKGDVNGDGWDDFYVGSATGYQSELYLSSPQGIFRKISGPWYQDKEKEDTGATFLDVDGDGDLDLFVVSGGTEFQQGSAQLDDRLYLNDGTGKFSAAPEGAMIADHSSGSCVAAGDVDNDGDLDLFVGGRIQPGQFPLPGPGAVLINNGNTGNDPIFRVATKEINEQLRTPGMVTDALWYDFNNDGWKDMIVVGDWMNVMVFQNSNGRLSKLELPELEKSGGLWRSIFPFDFDGDGDIDFILGNAGLNLPWKASSDQPLTIYYDDFNNDGKLDPIMTSFIQGVEYPVASRDELLGQIASLRKKFTTYDSYGRATLKDVLEIDQIEKSSKVFVHTLQSSVLENLGNSGFKLVPLPIEAQLSAVNAITSGDFNGDGKEDLILAGNFYPFRTQVGPSDAGMGVMLSGRGQGTYDVETFRTTGLDLSGDVRSMVLLDGKEGKLLVVARNNAPVSVFQLSPPIAMANVRAQRNKK